ncbi:MAG: hypothetical protein RL326_43 [Pseudomonadota bacterium]|jgi:hypothetical protein
MATSEIPRCWFLDYFDRLILRAGVFSKTYRATSTSLRASIADVSLVGSRLRADRGAVHDPREIDRAIHNHIVYFSSLEWGRLNAEFPAIRTITIRKYDMID